MNTKTHATEIEAEATLWALRVTEGVLSQAEQRQFDQWCGTSVQHEGAFIRAMAAEQHFRRLGALSGGNRAATFLRAPWTRNVVLAASIVGALLCGLAAAFLGTNWRLTSYARGDHYQSDIGEVRTVKLTDGSVLTLNTGSEVYVRLKQGRREVQMEHGEVFYEVASDAKRPFYVEVDHSMRVRAIGTAFVMRHDSSESETTVTVAKGAVEILMSGGGATRRLVEYQRATTSVRGLFKVWAVREADLARRLAWRDGLLVFDGDSLGTAIEEVNRYRKHPVVIRDAQLASRPLLGAFRTSDTETFLRSVEVTFDCHAHQNPDGSIVLVGGA